MRHDISADKSEYNLKILNRVFSHQLVILENPPETVEETNDPSSNQSASPPSNETKPSSTEIMKPSSLNYKVTLKDAVDAFIKKEAGGIESYTVEVEEEPIWTEGDPFDDILFDPGLDMLRTQRRTKRKVNVNMTLTDIWNKQEDKMRKKIEKSSISLIKNKVA